MAPSNLARKVVRRTPDGCGVPGSEEQARRRVAVSREETAAQHGGEVSAIRGTVSCPGLLRQCFLLRGPGKQPTVSLPPLSRQGLWEVGGISPSPPESVAHTSETF